MNLLLWVGNEANQKALANKLAKTFNIVGIITESRTAKRQLAAKKIFETAIERMFYPSINKAWWGMKDFYEQQYPNFPETQYLDVENINSKEAYEFSNSLNPDLIIVSGTRLIKGLMLSIPCKKGMMNLHTGLSPYIKGGPNCTNWCIATEQFHLVGNTVMWIDEGIDSGNIVTTEFAPVNWNSSLLDVHISVMEHAHDLYQKAISFIAAGGKSNIPQSEVAKGKTYYTKEWTLKNKAQLVKNFKHNNLHQIERQIKLKRKQTKTVSIAVGNSESSITIGADEAGDQKNYL